MRTNNSFGVDFIARRNKKNREIGLLYARISVNGEPKEISLQETLEMAEWDCKNEVVTTKGIRGKTVNSLIEETRLRLKDIHRHLQNDEPEFTAQTVKDRFFGNQKKSPQHKLRELTAYFKKIFEKKMEPGGYKNYKTTIDYIDRFLQSTTETGDIFLEEVNTQTITDFEHYVRTTPIKENDPCLGNGVGKHIQRFKRIFSWAKEIKWIAQSPVEDYRCIIKKNKRKKLSMQEVIFLENKHFSNPSLNYARDLFLFSCYTSFAYIDVMTITEDDFEFELDGRIWCLKYREKSDELQSVLLLKKATELLHKYRNKDSDRKTIFPFITNQTVNRSLHIIQEACEFTTPMTFHVARHTFAKTVALKNGVRMEVLQKIMGHTKITTTQVYADVDEEIIADEMASLEKRLEVKREQIHQSQLKAV